MAAPGPSPYPTSPPPRILLHLSLLLTCLPTCVPTCLPAFFSFFLFVLPLSFFCHSFGVEFYVLVCLFCVRPRCVFLDLPPPLLQLDIRAFGLESEGAIEDPETLQYRPSFVPRSSVPPGTERQVNRKTRLSDLLRTSLVPESVHSPVSPVFIYLFLFWCSALPHLPSFYSPQSP